MNFGALEPKNKFKFRTKYKCDRVLQNETGVRGFFGMIKFA